MSATQMIATGARHAQGEAFLDWANEANVEIPESDLLQACVLEPIYGPVIASNMEHMIERGVEPELAVAAVIVLRAAATKSANRYYSNRSDRDLRKDPSFLQSLGRTQALMATGTIEGAFMPEEFVMIHEEGRQQVQTACLLLAMTPEIDNVSLQERNRLLSDTNYSLYFSFRTMADGEDVLKHGINDLVESKTEDQMPHVQRTNLAIGGFIGGLVEASRGWVTIIDIGAGTAGTSAPIASALSEKSDCKKVSLHALESNLDFVRVYDSLAETMVRMLELNNHCFGRQPAPDKRIRAGEPVLQLIHDDATAVIDRLDKLPNGKKDVTVVAANYIWHRLTVAAKEKMIAKIDGLSPDSVFLVADLEDNASVVNRHYFNFGNNGILNCGNRETRGLLQKNGYTVLQVGIDIQPSSIHSQLLERISKEPSNDGHFWIAFKGDEAERLVYVA